MKNNSKTDRRRLLGISMRVILSLVMVGLLVVPVAVQADLKVTGAVYAWDFAVNKFQNSNVVIPWDGTWIPFLHELNFDGDIWPAPTGDTPWAGIFYYGLYHVDNAPLGAAGFQESQLWSLVSCDRNNDGKFGPGDLGDVLSPYDRGTVYAECLPSAAGGTNCIVEDAERDVEYSCTTGNCETEIVTTIRLNLDLINNTDGTPGADGLVDPAFPADADLLCWYALARTPTPSQVATDGLWAQTLQARVSQGLEEATGDRTVSFAVDPTAVELAAFDAAAQANGVLLTWETASEIDNLGFNLYRADSQVGQLVKINQFLIASQNPGALGGAAYSFLDESAAPGATYYYWLEDIDAAGTATKHGPATAKTAAAKALPGRPRPAPMPSNAF